MFNRTDIMNQAWKRYRAQYGRRRFDRSNFAYCLRCAWGEAHRATKSMAQIRAEAIRYELATLDTRSFQQNVEPLRRKLASELAALAA
ncbi:hypothetical protein [Mesorhizobium sp. L-8-3]|uniref:hypothetical protein n=1 Tax=Mesorhizobium sp. L-8-3 TaxID=2744522 RepID=UPI001925E9A8|nr:hypothetical protein [Mesorhizobium sp. L-8-3]BCH22097.1 hypothetical protein MesoLjLb_18820 [Mesorhizobium sp. L-8-3]